MRNFRKDSRIVEPAQHRCDSSRIDLMSMNSIEDVGRQQVRLHVRQPKVFAEAVAGDRFNAAVFAVGIGVSSARGGCPLTGTPPTQIDKSAYVQPRNRRN